MILLVRPRVKLNEEHFTFHLQYKHSGAFANCKCEELSYPKNQLMCYPILVTLLKMQPHYSQSSHKNATPSSGTSPLASYKELTPPPRPLVRHADQESGSSHLCHSSSHRSKKTSIWQDRSAEDPNE